MKLPRLLAKKTAPPPARPGLCQARTGLGSYCQTPVPQDKRLCDFHDSLAGPWSKPDQHFEKFKRR